MLKEGKKLLEEEMQELMDSEQAEKERTLRKKLVDELFGTEKTNVSYMKFKELMKDDAIRTDVAKRLLDDIYTGMASKVKLSEMKDLIKLLDKHIFTNIKERKLTFD